MRHFKGLLTSIILIVSTSCLWGATGSIQYDLWVEREYTPFIEVYFADVNGEKIERSETVISFNKGFDDPQILVAVRNNLKAQGSVKVKMHFDQFRCTEPGYESFRGTYMVFMWRYKSVKLEDGTTWQDQSNLLDKNTLQWSAVNNQGFDKSWVVNKDNTCNQTWGINATNNGSDVRTWYYALMFLFHGDYTRGSVDYYYPEDLQYTATITVEIIGL